MHVHILEEHFNIYTPLQIRNEGNRANKSDADIVYRASYHRKRLVDPERCAFAHPIGGWR